MKKKLNWIEYYIGHCWMTGWKNIRGSFRIWSDLMRGNYKDYALMFYDDPYEECYSWFWQSLGEDDTLPKDFLEHLYQMAEDIETGKVKTVPFTREMFNEIDDLIGDLLVDKIELDEELPEEDT